MEVGSRSAEQSLGFACTFDGALGLKAAVHKVKTLNHNIFIAVHIDLEIGRIGV